MSKKMPNQFTIRFKNSVDPRILEFANLQDNFSDTILYLIEKEIGENGIRNLQTVIPPVRSIEGFSNMGHVATSSYVPPMPTPTVAQPTSIPVTPDKDLVEVKVTTVSKPIEEATPVPTKTVEPVVPPIHKEPVITPKINTVDDMVNTIKNDTDIPNEDIEIPSEYADD
jgi:hypothetical protein